MNKKEYEEYVKIQTSRSKGTEYWDEEWFNRMYQDFKEYLKEPFLDIGTRRGELLEFLAEKGHQDIYGLDIAEPSVKIAREKGLNVVLGDMHEEMPFKSKFFKSISLIHTFEHCYNPDKVLKQINKILNGYIYIHIPVQVQLDKWKAYGDYTNFENTQELEEVFKKNGFTTIKIWKQGQSIYYIGSNKVLE